LITAPAIMFLLRRGPSWVAGQRSAAMLLQCRDVAAAMRFNCCTWRGTSSSHVAQNRTCLNVFSSIDHWSSSPSGRRPQKARGEKAADLVGPFNWYTVPDLLTLYFQSSIFHQREKYFTKKASKCTHDRLIKFTQKTFFQIIRITYK